jgi:hypothetical protein
MKAALLIEDRDLGFLFTDRENAHPDAVPVDVEIDSTIADCLEDEDKALWLARQNGNLRVVPHLGFDFNAMGEQTGYSIPTPIIVDSLAEYELWQAEN